jgi:hypothetical protein
MEAPDFVCLYDFSLIEKAVQDFFVGLPNGAFVAPAGEDDPAREQWSPPAGLIPFYTPEQALVLQACRPRVGIMETQFMEYPSARIVDANGSWRASAWKGQMKFAVVTAPNYAQHRKLRALVASLIPRVGPQPANIAGSGVNALLKWHQVGLFELATGDTAITPAEGFYLSTWPVNLTFSVNPGAWPGGTLTG